MSLNVVYHHKQARRADDQAYEERELRRKLEQNERKCQVELHVAPRVITAASEPLKRRRISTEAVEPLFSGQKIPMDALARIMVVGGAAVALMLSRTCKWLHDEYRRILQRNREAKKENRPQDVIPLRTDLVEACLDRSGLWENVLNSVHDGYVGVEAKRLEMLRRASRDSFILEMVSFAFTGFLRRLVMFSPVEEVSRKVVHAALLKGKTIVLEMVAIYEPMTAGDYLNSEGIMGVLSSVGMIQYLVKKGYKLDKVLHYADKCASGYSFFGNPFPDIDGAREVIEYIFCVENRPPVPSMLKDEQLMPIVLRTYSAAPSRADPHAIYDAVLNHGDEELIKLALKHWVPPFRVVRSCIEVISRESAVLLADKFSYDQLRELIEDAATFRCETDCFYGLYIAMANRFPGRRMPPFRWGASRVSRRLIADVQARLKEAERLVGQALWGSNPTDPNVGVTDSDPDSDEDSDSGSD